MEESADAAVSRRFRCKAAYDGTRYAGWQYQPDEPTVQGAIEAALTRVTGEFSRVTGAGRTDSGVHATGQTAHWDSSTGIEPAVLERALNAVMEKDIRLYDLMLAPDGFHARYSASRRVYLYRLLDRRRADSVLERNYSWVRPLDNLEFNVLQQAAGWLDGELDFSAFSKTGTVTRTNLCRIEYAVWERKEGEYTFTIRADRFLRGMVRMLVGAMTAVAAGQIPLERFRTALFGECIFKPSVPAPACGLILKRVEYPAPFDY